MFVVEWGGRQTSSMSIMTLGINSIANASCLFLDQTGGGALLLLQ